MSVDVFFFDIDGTLVDSNGLHVKAWHEAFTRCGQEIAPAVIAKQIGKGADMLIPTLLPDSDQELRRAIDRAHGDIFKSRYLREVQPFEGAYELLEALQRRKKRIVLASSAKPEEMEHYVDLLGVGPLLFATVTSGDVDRSKPAGDIFAAALQRVAPTPATGTLAVGDTPYDVESAQKSGIETVAVLSGGFSDGELRGAGALAIYADVRAILGDVEQLLTLRG